MRAKTLYVNATAYPNLRVSVLQENAPIYSNF